MTLDHCHLGDCRVLDPCCGSRMFWFDKTNPEVIFGDIREEQHTLCDGRTIFIAPDSRMDFRALPFPDERFSLVVFDPPHLVNAGPQSWMAKKYGKLGKTWQEVLQQGFRECFRVLKEAGVLVFKWNETQIPLREILLIVDIPPLFGNKKPQKQKTHWLCFMKPNRRA
ncbi:MAG: class I SAM-dependent methyltransferase [Candidatus Accumulibacter sp.]|nr:class I SAM-dependent methyltransferase [Accumulibacter sp.]